MLTSFCYVSLFPRPLLRGLGETTFMCELLHVLLAIYRQDELYINSLCVSIFTAHSECWTGCGSVCGADRFIPVHWNSNMCGSCGRLCWGQQERQTSHQNSHSGHCSTCCWDYTSGETIPCRRQARATGSPTPLPWW